MTRKNIPTLDEFWRALAPRLPALSPQEQRAAIVLLRALAKGEPVAPVQLARGIGASTAEAEALLQRFPLQGFVYPDPQGRVAGFFGLATAPTHHRFTLEGRTLWTWCAGDSLFLPDLLGETAEVESRDPEGGELVRLRISPARVEAVEPEGVVLSMVRADAPDFTSAVRIMATACHFIFFFASRASGERWVRKHPQTWLLSLNEGFAFAKRWNASVFGPELARRAGAA